MSGIAEDLFGDDVIANENVPEEHPTAMDTADLVNDRVEEDLFGDEASLHSDNDADDLAETTREISTAFEIANFRQPYGDNGDLFLAKLPSFLDLEPYAFDSDVLLAEIQQSSEAIADNDEKMIKKRSLVNTLRWKTTNDVDGHEHRVSNGRFVKWSDGTMSLQVGDELFDVPVKNIEKDHSYLTMMHAEEGLLRSMQRFVYLMSFQPYGLSSKSHAELKADIARRAISSKGRTVKLHTEMIDPAEIQKQAIKADNEKQKARKRLDSQKARSMNHANSGRDRTQLTARYLDDSDDELGTGSRQRYADENEDGFIDDDELSDLEESEGIDRLQALKAAGAAMYQERRTKRSRSGSDVSQLDDEDPTGELIGASEDSEEEAAMTPKHEMTQSDLVPRSKKLKRRIAESDEDD